MFVVDDGCDDDDEATLDDRKVVDACGSSGDVWFSLLLGSSGTASTPEPVMLPSCQRDVNVPKLFLS